MSFRRQIIHPITISLVSASGWILGALSAVLFVVLPYAVHGCLFYAFSQVSHIQDECFARLIACPGMIQALHRCGAAAPAFQTCSVMSKPPSAPPLYWHQVRMRTRAALSPPASPEPRRVCPQDWGFWGHEITAAPPHKLFAFIYLCDTSRENGCLRLIPGSHANVGQAPTTDEEVK